MILIIHSICLRDCAIVFDQLCSSYLKKKNYALVILVNENDIIVLDISFKALQVAQKVWINSSYCFLILGQAECDMAQRAEALKEEINRIKSDYEQLLAQNASLIRHISFGRFRRLCSPVSSNSGRQPSTSPAPAMIA
nr:bZIP transcription factor 16-like isoform X2 [Ipomoea batatas]